LRNEHTGIVRARNLSGGCRRRVRTKEVIKLRVQAPVIILVTAEARVILAARLRAAGLAASQEIARRGQGLEMAHFQIVHEGVTLAFCSRLPRDGVIEIELGVADPRQPVRVIPPAELRGAEARAHLHRGCRPWTH
jgi:hypothetical protein